ncbi:MAG TPA: o-succinylbenzoate synthase [Terriglobales bacterium]|nr:o-succinylbenzoate synthase [Terriglobales bacterium]
MRIEAITLRELKMPLVHFFETSFGRTYTRRVFLVTLRGDGLEGWGECVAGEDPYYSEEYIEGAWDVITRYLAPALLGKRLQSGREVPALLARVREHRMAKAALENAAWDAEAQEKGLPLWKLLGGARREIACGVSIGIQDSHEQLLEKIETELAAGYQRIKVKVKPGWDLDVLAKIRARWPDILLSCDANSAYTLADEPHLKRFDRFKLLMIEQPLWSDDFYFHARLQKQLQTALCLDEAIRSARDAEAALELGACRIVNIKVGRVGGFSEAIAVHDVAQRSGIPVWCGGMLESGVGRSHNVALSTLANFRLPGDVSASKRYWKEDIIEPEVEVSPQGTIAIGDKPGRGYKVRKDLIEALTVREETLR